MLIIRGCSSYNHFNRFNIFYLFTYWLFFFRTYSYDSSESEGSETDGESDTEEELAHHLVAINKSNVKLKVSCSCFFVSS